MRTYDFRLCDKCTRDHGPRFVCEQCGRKMGGRAGSRFVLCGQCRKDTVA